MQASTVSQEESEQTAWLYLPCTSGKQKASGHNREHQQQLCSYHDSESLCLAGKVQDSSILVTQLCFAEKSMEEALVPCKAMQPLSTTA